MANTRGDNLNSTQKVIIDFIDNYIKQNGYSPSIREICKTTGLKSTSSVHIHLQKLKESGILVEGQLGAARTIHLSMEYNNRNIQTKGTEYYVPCMIGETVWLLEDDDINPYTVQSYFISKSETLVHLISKGKKVVKNVKDFGSVIYTYREYAVNQLEKQLSNKKEEA